MSKNKQKKLARKAASQPISHHVTPPSNPNPATTTSNNAAMTPSNSAENDTSAISLLYSEGPTLPIIGAAGGDEPVNQNNPPKHAEHSSSAPSAKKRRSTSTPVPTATTTKKAKATPPTTDLTPLYEPWTLLPSSLRQTLRSHLETPLSSSKAWTNTIAPIVYTRNQNIKTALNRLKIYVGYSTPSETTSSIEVPSAVEEENCVIAISAQGEGTVKLVGVVELLKGIVGGKKEDKGGEEGNIWYFYTSLAGREMPRKRKGDKDGEEQDDGGDENGEDAGFETLQEVQRRDRRKSMVTVPVLTVWISRKRIGGFGDEFGEKTIRVGKARDQG